MARGLGSPRGRLTFPARLLGILVAIAIAGTGCAASQTSEPAGAVAAREPAGAVAAKEPASAVAARVEPHLPAGWAPCNRNARSGQASTFRPLSSRAAAALVTHQPETRPFNARQYVLDGRRYPSLNSYVPSRAQLARFRRARLSDGRAVVRFNPYLVYVDGRDGLRHPSTDDLIQWGAHKWGIPADWLRAEYVQESSWNGFQLGDQATVSPSWYAVYPPQARVPGSRQVFESMGITQVKWRADGSVGAGTEPLRWESTAFNIDYQAAMVRFYYDNPGQARSSWGDSSYAPCQAWRSIGGWFSPYPWGNSGQAQYVGQVQQHLASRAWALPDFVHWAPDSFPPGIRFR